MRLIVPILLGWMLLIPPLENLTAPRDQWASAGFFTEQADCEDMRNDLIDHPQLAGQQGLDLVTRLKAGGCIEVGPQVQPTAEP